MGTIDLTTDIFTIHQEDNFAVITILPGSKALSTTVSGKESLLDAMEMINAEQQIKGVVFLYADNYNSAAEDQNFFHERLGSKHYAGDTPYSYAYRAALNQFLDRVRTFPKPVISGMSGNIGPTTFAVNLAFDLRVVAEHTSFCHQNIKNGLPPSPLLAYYLVMSLGSPRATELMLTKSEFSAQEILDLGLINQIVPKTDLKKTCIVKLNNLSTISERALIETRRMLQPDIEKMDKYIDETFAAAIRCINFIQRSGA